ncbi:MAG: peptidase T [Erysipelothrix sp.]|jgi:tripeptide aminopeptidase|nr:peptidase T [Erysipelothrix sp.]
MQPFIERFIRYIKIDTRSDASSPTVPSTKAQLDFAYMLKDELIEIGCENVFVNDDNGFVMATIAKTTNKNVPAIGFIAHIDTADFESRNIKPQIVSDYDGQEIILNKELDVILSPIQFPNLNNYIGHTLITTDGTTLLGADNKAGMVAIIEAMKMLIADQPFEHGEIRIAFGPDEEIGRGANLFDVKAFNTEFAYTVDGSFKGQLEYESFNAAGATITIKGVSVHPGTAKNTMINAIKVAMELDSMLPQDAVPEKTEKREGFYLCTQMEGTIEDATMHYIIRDHDRDLFEAKKAHLEAVVAQLNEKYAKGHIELDMQDSYYNMGDVIKKDMRSVELAKAAMLELGIKPIIEPIRGGTDGSKITYMGIPTPNLFTGGENFHGKFEFLSVNDALLSKQTILKIVELHAK